MQSDYTSTTDPRRQRQRPERHRLVHDAWAVRPERSLRRSAAAAIAAVSRASGRIAQRLDENVVIPTH